MQGENAVLGQIVTAAFFAAIVAAVAWALVVDLRRRRAVARYLRRREREARGPEPEAAEVRYRREGHEHRERLRAAVTAEIGGLRTDHLPEPDLTVLLRWLYHPTVDLTRFTEHGAQPAVGALTRAVTDRVAARFGQPLADELRPEIRAVFAVRARLYLHDVAAARQRAAEAAANPPAPAPRSTARAARYDDDPRDWDQANQQAFYD